MDIEADFLSHRNDTTMLLENVIGSSIVALLITAFLPPYVLILRIVYGDIEFSTSSYRIIFHLGVADCTQLIFQIPAIVFNFLTETDAVRTISKVFGAFLHAGWVAYTALTLLLALNRFFVISDMKQTAFLCRRTPLTVQLAICWGWAFFNFITFLTPAARLTYSSQDLVWIYGGRSQYFKVFRMIALYSSIGELFLACVAYIAMFAYLYHTMPISKFFVGNTTAQNRELRLLICGLAIFVAVYWNCYCMMFYPGRLVIMSTNLLWIINSGANPFIYACINRSLRTKLYRTIRCLHEH
ncbi:hypothetical protein Tcan_03890 [Toxocara canis]|uniref:G_PROTEIN_RECEP_F1_2 domain-containing protein n=1 Tax=Toxocara canis TaxID=6265 RepID=A0A0B2UWJ2_TOXCA|nr:hypothetical protein Tcan_03890 [Toxocara canis]